MKIIECSSCLSKDLSKVIEFGEIPLAGFFPKFEDIPNQRKYNCNLLICDNCGLVQVDTIVSGEELFREYRYMSSISLSKHFSDLSKMLNNKLNLKNKRVLEIGSNDGVLLKPMMEIGIDCIGFEPSVNISNIAIEKGCNVINDFFNEENVKKYNISNIDVIIANNVFAHIYDINSVVRGIKSSLVDGGIFIAEVHYLLDLVNKNQYDFIYHEHIFYHSLYSLNILFKNNGMTIYDFDLIDVHSGSIRVYVKNGIFELSSKIISQIEKEKEFGITTNQGLKNFSKGVKYHLSISRDIIDELISNKREIIGFGSSGRGNVFCNLLKLGTSDVKYIFDESPERTNRFIPSCNIPIVKYTQDYFDCEYDVVLIFAWNYSNTIIKKIRAKDYLIMFPYPRLISGDKIEYIEGTL